MMLFKTIPLMFCMVIVLSACGKQQNGSSNDSTGVQAAALSDDSPLLALDSAISAINGSANEIEQTPSYAFLAPKKERSFFIASAYADACGLERFSPALGSNAECDDTRSVTSTFSGCTVGPANEFTLTGKVSLLFDNKNTCTTWVKKQVPTAGTVTRTSSDFVRTNATGVRVTTTSDLHSNYKGQSIGGGVQTTFAGSLVRYVNILGLHKKRILAGDVPGYDHSIRTTGALQISGSKAGGDRTITQGTISVDHNRLKYTVTVATVQDAALSWASNCCYPSSGSLNVLASGAMAASYSVTFGGSCGSVAIKDNTSGAVTALQLSACE